MAKIIVINVDDMTEVYGDETWSSNAYDESGDTPFSHDFGEKGEAVEYARLQFEAYKAADQECMFHVDGNLIDAHYTT